MHYAFPLDAYEKIFGPRQEQRATGRSKLCRYCGGWHQAGKVPHNCRPPALPPQELASPMVAPAFEDFVASPGSDIDEVIGSRNQKREYMKRNGLVEYAEGVTDTTAWARQHDEIKDIVEDIKMVRAMDPDRRRKDFGATEMVDGGSLCEGTEIDMDAVE